MNSHTTPQRADQGGASPANRSGLLLATVLVLDAVLVLVFSAIGRANHGLEQSIPGVFQSAWPFLVGLLLGWLISRVWIKPTALTTGLIIWVATVAVGQLLRFFTTNSFSVAFLIVSVIVLLVFLVGIRLIALGFRQLNKTPRSN
ncbi:DUF3054 domain-containing protein [Leucobacter sp. OH1287]|uniref:DUF3054 domain-containing protein n=1 Tax=Leucobacter sp. OH1287 TaxID=2491049 RepID=UPI000F5E227B|nr:DUF3054 domain-containing protein [Leucobacter sp. OH1287]RRD60611.1 DUF3054 domain-containing protein [Leucobacter sp. OH1287]